MSSTYPIPKAVESNEKCFLLKGFPINHTIKRGNGKEDRGRDGRTLLQNCIKPVQHEVCLEFLSKAR
jgi:hypothetical protein